ncbi:MAG: Dot/Icm secretion system ATPase DotB [Coxiella sp. (in: Bacteria)]|nr:MAG: Dot/Icm secretion system ATPase DotB [Coxiella sp. (in: g-proteobacteria)]
MATKLKYTHYFPDEPSRFESRSLDKLLVFCNRINASDITLQTNSPIMAEIYGRLYTVTKRPLSNSEVGDLLNAIYGPNGTTQIMRGTDIDTHYEVRPNRNERYRHRVNGVGIHVDGHEGIQITIRTIPATPPHLADLDLPDDITKAIAPQEGVVYVTGATGSGKSTLLAAIIRDLAEDPESHRKIITYEAPIEFVYDEINAPTSIVSQSEIPRHVPDFAAGVRNALRRKPRLILVGEARDTETISAVLEAALTGHPVYTTLHSNGVAETVRRLVGSFPKEERIGRTIDIIETMRLIIWQRLVPSVDDKRVALREYLVFDENVRDELLRVDPDRVTQKTRELVQKFGQPMQMEVDKRFEEGKISKRTHTVLTAGLKRNAID